MKTTYEQMEKTIAAPDNVVLTIDAASPDGVAHLARFNSLIGRFVSAECARWHMAGRLLRVNADCLVLDIATWIADCGDFTRYTTRGEYADGCPVPPEMEYFIFTKELIAIYPLPCAPKQTKQI